ncbi:MAG: Cna B-type domain-containing protein [Clostridia bacterium]|nr:Cna B-type domain-containing protein [Clostridia bacterium]
MKLTDGTNDVTVDANGATISEITLDGQTDTMETTAWTYEWTNLPKYNASGTEITYEVVETSAKMETNTELLAGTTVTAAHDDDTTNKPNERHLVNTLPTIPVGVGKTWITLAVTKPSVTFKIYSGTSEAAAAESNTEAAAAIVLNGTPDGTVAEGVFTHATGESTGTADAYENTAWHAQWNNLPKYTDTGALLYYVVKEDAVTNYTTAYPSGQTYATDTQSIENTELTEIEAVKNWVDATPASGDTVTFTLYTDGVAGQAVTVNGLVDVAETPGEGQETNTTPIAANAYEYDAWKAKWTNLSKYKVQTTENGGETPRTIVEIAYTVEETSFTFGGVTYNVTRVCSYY